MEAVFHVLPGVQLAQTGHASNAKVAFSRIQDYVYPVLCNAEPVSTMLLVMIALQVSSSKSCQWATQSIRPSSEISAFLVIPTAKPVKSNPCDVSLVLKALV